MKDTEVDAGDFDTQSHFLLKRRDTKGTNQLVPKVRFSNKKVNNMGSIQIRVQPTDANFIFVRKVLQGS